MGARVVFVVGSLWLAVSAGCDDGGPPHRTEVVVVIQSDLAIPSETDGLQVTVAGEMSRPCRRAVRPSAPG